MPRLKNRMERALLRGFEHLSVPTLEALNGQTWLRTLMFSSMGRLNTTWIHATTNMLWEVNGFDHVRELHAPRGVVVVSNHRSFCDMYVLCSLLDKRTPLIRRASFPVRSNFFYTNPVGMGVNILVSGGAMWPPIFRDGQRRELNRTALAQLAETLTLGSMVGIHPEGRRNPSEDPYDYLPVKPGLGHLLAYCSPETLVLPAFVAGLSNKILYECSRGWAPGAKRGEPIRLWFERPFTVAELEPTEDNAREVTERVFEVVRQLGERDRAETAHDHEPSEGERS